VKAYNDAVGSYDTRVMVSMRRFKELGAATGDDILPVPLVESVSRQLQSASQQDLLDTAIIEGEIEESRK
jgi:DNA recombination protein RmuC